MRVFSLSTLRAHWESHPDGGGAKGAAQAWYRHALKADWASPAQVKADFGNASILQDGRVVFSIAGNHYRLVVWINYAYRVVYIRFAGAHAAYERIHAQTI